MNSLNRETIISIVLLVLCGFLIWAGWQIRDPQFGELSPAAWPQAVSYVLTGFCLLYFLQSVLTNQSAETDDDDLSESSSYSGLTGWLKKYQNPIACFALYFLFLFTLPYFGTLIGGILLVFLLLSVLGGFGVRQLVMHAIIAVIAVGAMWALFTYGLHVLLPRGEILPSI